MFWIQIIFVLFCAFALFLLLYAVGHIGSGRTEKLEGDQEGEEWLLLVHQAYNYSRKGEYWKSIESAEKAIELNPRASESWRLIGNAYELLGDAMMEVSYTPLGKKIRFPRPHNEESEAIFLQCDGPKNYYKKATEAWNKAKEINPEIIIPGYHE